MNIRRSFADLRERLNWYNQEVIMRRVPVIFGRAEGPDGQSEPLVSEGFVREGKVPLTALKLEKEG